jgi:serine/threonine protein kinase
MVGRTLSHYKILEEIGRGGMGIVYRAVDLKLDCEVRWRSLIRSGASPSEPEDPGSSSKVSLELCPNGLLTTSSRRARDS